MSNRSALILLSLSLAANAANAQVVGIAASAKGSLFDQAATAIAKVATNRGGLPATLRNFTSSTVYIPAVDQGQVAFGIANQYELTLAYWGEGFFAGRAHPNLRAVAIIFPLKIAIFVRADSTITSIADLDGRRMPDGYVAQKIVLPLVDAELATAGLGRRDLQSLYVPNLVTGADAFSYGRTDAFIFALGAPKVREVNARRAIRALPIAATPENLAAVRRHVPVAYLTLESPSRANPGVTEPLHVIAYDTLVFTHADATDDVVYALTRATYEHRDELAAATPAFKRSPREHMVKDLGALRYHPGAIRFYRERDLWPPKR